MGDTTVFSAILMLLGFGSILFLAYVTTKYIAGKSRIGFNGKYLSIVEAISLGVDKRLCLVKAGNEYILIAVSGKRIDFLCNVNIDEMNLEQDEEKGKPFDFKSIFEKYVDLSYRKKQKNNEDTDSKVKEGTFSANLSRLKSITGKLANRKRKDGDESIDEN
ncbi:MAG: flagellar biosynthetic protein FliO [Acetivibrionales bacterium]|jgi:flagellar protein FliO/FliZ